MSVTQAIIWTLILFIGAFCFIAGWLMCERRQRKIRCVERERLRANLAAVSERNGQAATVPRTGRKARISKADMSRSDTRFQDQISGERRATYWLPHGKVDSHADD